MANNKIKGLTVEIGGDTTKLGKALDSVEKKSRDLSSELGEINKLLKFDPGNADLLAQKQKVLADAIQNTGKKLDTLKEAEKQVQEQFKRGEVSEEQVRALQREIMATEKKMDGYAKAAKETADAIDQLGDGSKEAVDGTKKTEKGADDAADALDDMADSADKAGDKSEGLGSKLGSAAKVGFQAIASAATAVVGALVGAAEATREYRAEMGKLDAAFTANGHSAETATSTYKTLQGVIGETDQSVEAAQQISLLADSEEDAAKWAEQAAGVVGQFGDALQPETFFEAANETMKLGEATGAYVQMLEGTGMNVEEFNAGLAACNTEAEKQAYMLQVTEQALGAAGDRYREANAEIIRANEANEAWTASMAEAGAAIEPILTDVKLLGSSLLSDLLPGIQGVADGFRSVLNGDEGGADALGEALSGIIDSLLTKVRELAPTLMQVAISLITTLTTSLLAQLPHVTRTLMQMLEQAINQLAPVIPELLNSLIDSAFGILNNLLAYLPDVIAAAMSFLNQLALSLPSIIENISSWLPEIIDGVCTALELGIPTLIEGAVSFFVSIIQAIPVLIEQLVPQIPNIVTSIIDCLILNIPVLLEGAVTLLNAIVEAIPLLLESLLPQVPTIVETIVSKLGEMAPVLLSAAVQLLWEIIKAIPQIVSALFTNLPSILSAITSVLGALPSLLWEILTQVLGKIGEWIVEMAGKAKEAGSKFLDKVVEFFKQLPGKLGSFLTNVINKVKTWASNMATKAKEAGTNMLNNVINIVKNLPSKTWSAIKGCVDKVKDMGTQMLTKAKDGMKKVVEGITSKLKETVSKVKTIGGDIVKGIWNGINDKVEWIKNKLMAFKDAVLNKLKEVFGIASPSKVMKKEVGVFLAEGVAEGLSDSDAPVKAVEEMNKDILDAAQDINGVTLNRQLNTTFRAEQAPSAAETGILGKLDNILKAIEQGKIIALDGEALVGATLASVDAKLGTLKKLTARGAL